MDIPFLAFPLLEGEELKTWRQRESNFPIQDAELFLELARQMAEGLADIHRAGQTHGDLPGS